MFWMVTALHLGKILNRNAKAGVKWEEKNIWEEGPRPNPQKEGITGAPIQALYSLASLFHCTGLDCLPHPSANTRLANQVAFLASCPAWGERYKLIAIAAHPSWGEWGLSLSCHQGGSGVGCVTPPTSLVHWDFSRWPRWSMHSWTKDDFELL